MQLQTRTIIWLAVLLIALVLLSWATWTVARIQKPLPGNCSNILAMNPGQKWSSNCQYIQELQPDASLKTPTQPMYLTSFTNTPSMGPSWGGIYVWYRYKYVNVNTGGYGQPGPWTLSAITAGSNTLPCQGGDCSQMNYAGKDSCTANLAQLGVDNIDYTITSGIYANVHRYVSTDPTPPGDTSSDEIVGYLVPQGGGRSYMFIDVSDSPCTKTNCGTTQGC